MIKKTLFYFITVFVIPLAIFEMLFQLLPVRYPPHILRVDSRTPIARYQPNVDYTWSKGWNFSIVTKKHTNNFGFANSQDYFGSAENPLMVVIGDSFVEANQVENSEALGGILSKEAGTNGRVYSIGLSGAALPQYLAFAEFAKRELRPDSMVFVIIGNDFDESFRKYKSSPMLHYFEKNGETYDLKVGEFEVGLPQKIARKSAFVRYLMLNLGIKQVVQGVVRKNRGGHEQFIGYVPRNVAEERLRDAKIAIDEFLRQLPDRSGLDADRILFVVDGIRPNLYPDTGLEETKGSFFDEIRTYFIQRAHKRGYETIDMQPVFTKSNRKDGSRFEFTNDLHWNRLGHQLVAREISGSRVYAKTGFRSR